MDAKPITFTTIEGDLGRRLDKMFGVKYSFMKVEPGGCLLPPQFIHYGTRIRDLEVYEDDVWLTSFPRTGSHWTQEMVWCIGNDFDYEKAQTLLLLRNPLLEGSSVMVSGKYVQEFAKLGNTVENIQNLPRIRYIKSHLPVELLPQEIHQKKPKMIYVARNPKDTCVSFYHYLKLIHDYTATFDEFADLFLQGYNPLGSFWSHVLKYWEMRDQENVLFLTYEELKKNQVDVIKRTAKFLGKSITEEQIAGLCEHLKFSNMAANPAVNLEHLLPRENVPENERFIRKGKVGDWRNYMSEELSQRFDEVTEKYMRGSGLRFETEVTTSNEE